MYDEGARFLEYPIHLVFWGNRPVYASDNFTFCRTYAESLLKKNIPHDTENSNVVQFPTNAVKIFTVVDRDIDAAGEWDSGCGVFTIKEIEDLVRRSDEK